MAMFKIENNRKLIFINERPFKLTIEMPDEDSMYCAHKIVNDLNKGKLNR